MVYEFIDLTKIFIYKALPENMKARVLKLPTHMQSILPPSTGFPTIDLQQKEETILSVNWLEMPERHLTQCAFIDAFTALVHQHGYKRVDFYAWKLNLENRSDLSATIKALAGIPAKEFIIQYTLQMARDLRHRTNLNKKEIGEVLRFPSRYSFLQFIKKYDK